MNTIAYIAIVAAVIIGFFMGMLISSLKKRVTIADSIGGEKEDNGLILELESRISSLQSKCDELRQVAEAKESELSVLHEQIIADSGSLEKDLLIKMKTENDDVVKKLKRQISDTEEELEEAESNAKRLKRQLEEKVTENGKLIDEISASKRSIDDLTTSLDSLKSELDGTSKRLCSVTDSLAFIQEVLTARPIASETLYEKDQKINALSHFIFFDLQELFKQHFSPSDLSNYIFGQGLNQWEAVKRKSWIEGKKTIAFIGEFSAGKTSIVNRLLSQDSPNVALLPVSAKATTAIPTYIAGGDYTTYQFYSPEGNLKKISEESFKKVSKEILSNIDGVSELIKYFVMTYKNPHLAGMSILDTPGFSSGDEEDAVRTIDVINECDALFWVFDVNAGTVNRSSLEVIKNNMNRPLYVIINKIDTKSKSEVDSVEKLIRKAFENEGIPVEGFIRFSSKAPLNELMNTIASVQNDSSAEEYLSVLSQEFMPSLISACERDEKEAVKKLDSTYQKCDKKWNSIVKLCQTIQNDSINARDIPHWETHLFSKDRYEMDATEGNQLRTLLEKVANQDIVKLSKQIGEYGDLMQENQLAYGDKNEEAYILQQFRECQNRINHLISDLYR